jgi:hypothetical protein
MAGTRSPRHASAYACAAGPGQDTERIGPGLGVALRGSADGRGGCPWANGSPAETGLPARSRSQGRTSAAWTGRWSLGYCPRSEYVLIEDQFVTTAGDVRIQSMRAPPVTGAW